MRKTIVTLCIASLAFASTAQKQVQGEYRMLRNDRPSAPAPVKKSAPEAKEIIFVETFNADVWRSSINDEYLAVPANMPAGWEVYDNTGNNYFWHWSDRGPRGSHTSNQGQFNDGQMIKSESDDNDPGNKGHMSMELNYFNTTPDWQLATNAVEIDSYIQTPAIDCSAAEGVSLKFAQYGRFCCKGYDIAVGPKVTVSTDGVNFDNMLDVKQMDLNSFPATNPAIYDVSITDWAAGQSTVYLRFHVMGMQAYTWQIDDITVYEPAPYDARFTYHWADYGNEAIAYNNNTYIEKLFLGVPFQVAKYALLEFTTSRAHSSNVGLYNIDNLRLKTTISSVDAEGNATELNAVESAGIALAAGSSDTTLTAEHYYTIPAEVGQYEVKGQLLLDHEDGVMEDNEIVNRFNVTENVIGYANPRYVHSERASPFNWSTATDGDGLGIVISLNPSTTGLYDLQGVNVYIQTDNYNYQIWEQGGVAYLQAQLCANIGTPEVPDFDLANPIVSTESTPIDSTSAGAWVFLPFTRDGAAEYLTVTEPRTEYYLHVRLVTNGMGTGGAFYIGADNQTQASYNGFWVTLGGNDEEGWAPDISSLGIELVCNEFGAEWPTSNLTVSMVNTNPVSGVVEPAYGADFTLFVPDGEGGTEERFFPHYNGTPIVVNDLKNGSYGYKASYTAIIGGVADSTVILYGAVAVQGGEARLQVDFKRNSIDEAPVAAPALSVYPNPAGNIVTINTLNANRIVISNLLGQTLNVISSPADRQVVSLAGYEAGVYMVTVFDQNGGQNTERVVKN